MKYRLVELLRCPRTSGKLTLSVHTEEERTYSKQPKTSCRWYCAAKDIPVSQGTMLPCGQCYRHEIVEGTLTSEQGDSYPIVNGIPRLLVRRSNKVERYQKQNIKEFKSHWQFFMRDFVDQQKQQEVHRLLSQIAAPESETTFYNGMIALNIGSGSGGYEHYFSRFNADIVGIDISDAIERTALINRNNPQAHFVQANALFLPFAENYFDVIFSSGTINYTGNPKGAFSQLSAVLKSGGRAAITIFPRLSALVDTLLINFPRMITIRLPAWLTKALCYIPVPLLSFLNTQSGVNLKNSTWRNCVRVVFVLYYPRYLSRYTNEEVIGWFEEFGYTNIETLTPPVTVKGVKT